MVCSRIEILGLIQQTDLGANITRSGQRAAVAGFRSRDSKESLP